MERYTDEWRKAIAEDYRNGKPIKTISQEFDTDAHMILKCVDEFGVPRRRKEYASTPRKRGAKKKCPRCRKTVDIKGARWCPFCGSDIRSEAEILDEKLNKLWSIISSFPSSTADEAREIIKELSAYLKKEG